MRNDLFTIIDVSAVDSQARMRYSMADRPGISGPYGEFLLAGAVATVVPGASSGTKPMQHPGEELLLVLEGVFEFEVSDVVHPLGPGDAIQFRTQQPHTWRNPGTEDAVIVWLAVRPQ